MWLAKEEEKKTLNGLAERNDGFDLLHSRSLIKSLEVGINSNASFFLVHHPLRFLLKRLFNLWNGIHNTLSTDKSKMSKMF